MMCMIAACAGSVGTAEEEGERESAAARIALLAVAILTALSLQATNDKDPKIKLLLSAAWRVSHPRAHVCLHSQAIQQLTGSVC